MMLWPALVLGLAGSLHCVGMCGPIALALPGGRQRARYLAGRLLYNSGRVCMYALLGAIFGYTGKALIMAGIQQGLSVAVGVIMLVWLVRYLCPGRLRALDGLIPRLIAPLKIAIGRNLRRHALPAFFMVGFLNGLLPCGLVYLALAAATATGSARDGAVAMVVFGAGTVPAMLAVSLCGPKLQSGIRARFQRLTPVLVAMLALLFLLRGLSLGIPYISPDLTAAATSGACACCH